MESAKSSISNNCDTVSLQTEELATLVCPVCFEYMKPPIMQCINGHGICELCYELLSECPLCHGPLTNRRNSHLETLTALLLFPCKKCHKKFSMDELSLHKCTKDIEVLEASCIIGQIYGECTWRGLTKDMVEHCCNRHPNNYWMKRENVAKWKYFNLSNIGIQNVYLIDLTETIFVIVQKYDSEAQCLRWNIACECEKVSDQYVYEIQLFSDFVLNTLTCRNSIANEDNILASLPSTNEITIPLSQVNEYLTDDNFVNYRVIIRKKTDIQKDNSVKYYQVFTEIKSNNAVINEPVPEPAENKTCTQKTWYSIVDFYNLVKRRLGC